MEASLAKTTLWVLTVIALIWAWRVLNWLWLTPKRLERKLRQQGLQGNSYRILVGDTKEMFSRLKDGKSKPMNLSDDIVPHVFPFLHQTVNKYGMPLLPTSLFRQKRVADNNRNKHHLTFVV